MEECMKLSIQNNCLPLFLAFSYCFSFKSWSVWVFFPLRFKGVKKGGVTENTSYYIFTQCPDGAFEAFPVNNWYNFTPIAKHRTLTAEEAEEEWERWELEDDIPAHAPSGTNPRKACKAFLNLISTCKIGLPVLARNCCSEKPYLKLSTVIMAGKFKSELLLLAVMQHQLFAMQFFEA